MFGLLVLVGLFIALTPGVLFRLKGSKKISAAMHAVLFGVVVYLVSMYGPGYGVSYEGFQSTSPACEGTSTFMNGMCVATTPAMCSSGELGPRGKCYLSGKVVGVPVCPTDMQREGGVCTASTPAACLAGFNLTSDGMCENKMNTATSAAPGIAAGSEVICGEDFNRVFKIISVNPNKSLTVTDASNRQPGKMDVDTSRCVATSNYISKQATCSSTSKKLIVLKIRPDASMEVYPKENRNSVTVTSPGDCRVESTVFGAITSAITGK